MREVKRTLTNFDIKIQNRLKQSVYLVIKSDPNAMQIQKANLNASMSGGGVGGERVRQVEIQSIIAIAAGTGSHEWTPPSRVYVSGFIKSGNHFSVLFLNCQADRGCRYLVESEDFIGHVKNLETMEEWKEIDPATILQILQPNGRVGIVQVGGASVGSNSGNNGSNSARGVGGGGGGRGGGGSERLPPVAPKNTRKLKMNGADFEGEVNAGSLPEGRGRLVWPQGDVYEGSFSNGKIHGRGKFVYRDGNTYDGDFDAGDRHGIGKYVCKDWTYEGAWLRDKITGYGVKTTSVGIYSGNLLENKYHGLGVFVDEAQGGKVFDGVWEHGRWVGFRSNAGNFNGFTDSAGLRQGHGELKMDNGVYVGDFKDDKFHGSGKYTSLGGKTVYEGEWENGLYHGMAVYKDEAGVYTGKFKNGKKHGKGVFVDNLQGGRVFEGYWENDEWKGVEEAHADSGYIKVW